MKKVAITLPQRSWGSINSKFPANTINVDVDELVGGSKNFDTDTKGALVKRLGNVNFNPTLFSGTPKDLFEAVFTNGVRHLLIGTSTGTLRLSQGSNTIVTADMTQSTLSVFAATGNLEFALYLDRVYMGNGIDAPQVYDRTQVYGGVNYGVPVTGGFVSDAGAIAPTTAPTFAADSSGGSVPDGSHTYKITFLYYGFEESNGGLASAIRVVAGPNNTVNLTAIPIGGYGVSARKVYRDDNDGVYRLVGTVSNNTATTFADTALAGGALIPTDNGIPPLFSLITQHKDRNWMAGVIGTPSTAYFTDAGKPDIVRSTNTILCNSEDPITGYAVYNDRVIVFNRSSFGQILGTTSDTFRYSQFPGTIGCVDNRTIRVRTIRGVPVLVWLSDKGFYQFNGSSVDYTSEKIEDQVNLNIQQAAAAKGRNTQTSQADFQAGTASTGIDLTSSPGDITLANPKKDFSTQSDFEAGAVTDSIATITTSGSIQKNTVFAKTFVDGFTEGEFNNIEIRSNSLRLPIGSDFTGETSTKTGAFAEIAPPAGQEKIATSIIPSFNGTLGRIAIRASHKFGSDSLNWTAFVALDSSGEPGTEIGTASITLSQTSSDFQFSTTFGTSLNGGQKYWIGIRDNPVRQADAGSVLSGGKSLNFRTGDGWTNVVTLGGARFDVATSYEFTRAAVATSGSWISEELDTGVPAGIGSTGGFTLRKAGGKIGGTTVTVEIHSSDTLGFTPDASTLDATKAFLDAGAFSATLKRFVKIKVILTTNNDLATEPHLNFAILDFPTDVVWKSETIDHTLDVTVYNQLVINANIPGFTGANAQIETDDNAGFTSPTVSSGFAISTGLNTFSLSGVGAERFSRVIINLNQTEFQIPTPRIDDITYKWTVAANLVSQEIDALTIPAGWDIFQADFSANGGTVLLEMQTATSSGGSFSSFATVTNGAFPDVSVIPIRQFVKWRTTLTATADNVPVVRSVTINWFIELIAGIRATSIFFNRSYYVSASEFNETKNNIVFKLDQDNKWRVYKELNINVFSFFFNDPYFGSANDGQIVRFAQGQTDPGPTNITFDVRTKAHGFGTSIKRKVLSKVFVTGLNTGAAYTFSYSLDAGKTFLSLVDSDGSTSFTTGTDGEVFTKRLVPQGTINFQAPYLLIRVVNNDDKEVELHEFTIHVWIREGDLVDA